jgi:TolB-like protein/DNA-binding winged helix-turn-helix (wHTH) protein/Flp pilus assembly protein TadD
MSSVVLSGVSRLRFEAFELDLKTAELRNAGALVDLPPQPFKILALLASHAGQLVTRKEIRQQIWGGETFVDFEQGLNFAINKIRKVLGDDAETPRYIETLPRRGYRFIAAVASAPGSEAAPAVLKGVVTQGIAREVAAEGALAKTPEIAQMGAGVQRALPPKREWLKPAGMAVLSLAVVAGWFVWHRIAPENGRNGAGHIRSLAVLPLDNLSGDPSQEYFADGMTDELITDLASIASLRVISRTSTTHYKGTRKTLPEIARELNVDAVVEGSVARSANKVRIRAQLIDARNDRHLWAENYERDLGDILSVENTLALEIARQVRSRLTTPEQQRLERRAPVNPDAYDAYLKGRYTQTTQSPEGLKEGLPAFQQAIVLDPTFAPAYAGLSYTYSLLANYGVLSPTEAFPQAEAAARKALELDPNSPEAHTALAFPKHHYNWEWAAAEREYKTAIALSPSYPTAHLLYAEYLSSVGRHDEAIAEMHRSLELDPLSLVYMSNLGRFLYHARRYDEAIEVLKKTLELDPNRVYARIHLAMSYEEKGMYSEALQEYERIKTHFGGEPSPGMARLLAMTGQPKRAQEIARVLRGEAGDSDWFFIAGVYAALGDKDEAFACLQKAYEKHDFFLVFLKVYPYMDPLRSDPRYQNLLRRIGLS